MKYFLDTEFIEFGNERPIDLISIGIVAEDGREYYAETSLAAQMVTKPFDFELWHRENTIPHLSGGRNWKTLRTIRHEVVKFINGPSRLDQGHEKHEFWAWYADYDWVIFCSLFGRMIDLPSNYPKYCLDLKQVVWGLKFHHGIDVNTDELVPKPTAEHNALSDARWNRDLYEKLMEKTDDVLERLRIAGGS